MKFDDWYKNEFDNLKTDSFYDIKEDVRKAWYYQQDIINDLKDRIMDDYVPLETFNNMMRNDIDRAKNAIKRISSLNKKSEISVICDDILKDLDYG